MAKGKWLIKSDQGHSLATSEQDALDLMATMQEWSGATWTTAELADKGHIINPHDSYEGGGTASGS